jgi:PEGA domain
LTFGPRSREHAEVLLRNPSRFHRTTRRLLEGLPVGLTVLLAASLATAQTASPEDIASARSLGTEGIRLADAGDCNGAIPKLDAAEKLFHAPTTLDRLGECQISIGQIVAGTESLQRVVRESLAPNAPAAFVNAKKHAQQALAAAQPRIGSVKIHVDGASADKVTITVDGAAVSSALLDADRPTDPGMHQINVTATGYRAATASVTVREGAEATVSLKLELDPNAVAVAPPAGPVEGGVAVPAAAGPAPAAPPPASGGLSPAFGAVALGVGGLGLAAGTVFGILALSTKSTLDSDCTNKVCQASSQSNINSLNTQATLSTVGFAVGIVGVAAGVILLVVSHKTESALLEPRGPHVSPWLGIGTAGVGGTFQ